MHLRRIRFSKLLVVSFVVPIVVPLAAPFQVWDAGAPSAAVGKTVSPDPPSVPDAASATALGPMPPLDAI
jgi:hypothetical protein